MRRQPLYNKAYIFIIATIVISALETLFFSTFLPDNSTTRLRIVLFTADSALLYLIFWFAGQKFRISVVVLNWLLTLYLISNSLYFNYWGDMYSMPSIFQASSYNSFAIKAAIGLWSWSQTLMVAASVIVTCLYIILKPYNAPKFTATTKLVATALTIALFASGFYLSARSIHNWHRLEGHPEHTISEVIAHRYDRQSYQVEYFRSNGLTGYIIAQIINYPHAERIEISNAERTSIEDFIRSSATAGDSILYVNRNKNLVFIIVESLNSWVIDKWYGNHELTPNLNRLLREEGVISCTNMYAQIRHGGSSDGQLIYNTGLLPVATGVTVQNYISATYPSIVKTLKPASSAEFIVENAMVYNHRGSSEAFGYDSIYDALSLEKAGLDKKIIGADRAVFSLAFDTMQRMTRPFVAEITTLSMHYPFDIEGFEPVEWIDSVASDNYYLNHYLQTVNYTDHAIGEFVRRLKASKMWPNTVVVIASDHDTTTERHLDSDDSPECLPIVFMALNTGTTLHSENIMGQIDVFPTILDIMGADDTENRWRGLGHSLLSSSAPKAAVCRTGQLIGSATEAEAVGLRRAFSVSDSIIRADFFTR